MTMAVAAVLDKADGKSLHTREAWYWSQNVACMTSESVVFELFSLIWLVLICLRYVLLLDFNSLYPSIVREHNICFTTVQHPGFDVGGSMKQYEEPMPGLEQVGTW